MSPLQNQQDQSKTVLITGSGRRIGAEIARVLHANGFNIILHYHHSAQETQALFNILNEKRPHSAEMLKADLSDFSALDHLIKKAANLFGRLDVLINNASAFYKTDIGTVTSEAWDKLMDINLKAPFFLSQAAFPHLHQQQGCIINIVDIHAKQPMRDYSVYCISKAGLKMLTLTLAQAFAPDVRVNAISPGLIILPEGENALSPLQQEKILQEIPLQRVGDPTQIAKTALFLIQEAGYITGQDLAIDGGRSLN